MRHYRTFPADEPLTIGAVMTPYPVTVGVDMPLDEVAEILAENDVTGVPVLDAGGCLVGVLSQTDLIRLAAMVGPGRRPWAGYTARHAMTRPVVTARVGMTLAEAARRLERHDVHRLVIVADDDRTPIGVVSASDLLPLLIDAGDP